MITQDTCCTLVPYFKVHDGKLDEFKAMCPEFVKLTENEPKCMFYAFTFNDHEAHCREGYEDAEGILEHLGNVGEKLQQALKIADITRVEAHGPAAELEKLREPLKDLNPAFFALEGGFRRRG